MADRSWERWVKPETKAFNILYERAFNFLKGYNTGHNQAAIQDCLNERVQDFNEKIKLCKDADLIYELVDCLQDGGDLYSFLGKHFDIVYEPNTEGPAYQNMWGGEYKWEQKDAELQES